MRFGDLPRALLRYQYRLARIPLQVIEDIAAAELDARGPVRLAYEQFLIDCDRAAAYLLNDEKAATRAADLTRHTLRVRMHIAREQHRIHRDRLILLHEHRARFNERRHHRHRGTDPA